MHEVAVSRFVRETPEAIGRLLTPERIVGYEGSFTVRDVTETPSGTIVTVGSTGLTFRLRFEIDDETVYYTQDGDAGPFESMETWLTYRRKDDGTVVTAHSVVSLAAPIPGIDRIAGWKRRGELKRALNALAEDVE
ncbi:MAG: SRPBCC family protein [Halobacteriota archaeon]